MSPPHKDIRLGEYFLGHAVAVVDQLRRRDGQVIVGAENVGDRAVDVIGIYGPLGRVLRPHANPNCWHDAHS
jgi:hypothetical protein